MTDTPAIPSGWWLETGTFGCFGRVGRFSATDSSYLGGWSKHPKTYTRGDKILVVSIAGVGLKAFKAILTIPWADIADLEVGGSDSVTKRVTFGRAATMGILALAAKKKTRHATLIVTTISGDEAVFQTEKLTAPELNTKLTPLILKLHKAHPKVVSAAEPTSVADELAKLASLRDSGVLSQEEFDTQKQKLLN